MPYDKGTDTRALVIGPVGALWLWNPIRGTRVPYLERYINVIEPNLQQCSTLALDESAYGFWLDGR